jgi:Leucine-rich repeat (LRR) protein
LGAGFVVNEQKNKEVATEVTSTIAAQVGDNVEQTGIVTEETQKKEEIEVEKPSIGSSKILDLSGQDLTKAPSYIFDKTSIQELDLSNNKLDGSLQAEVRQLQNLKVLDLSDNQFTGVPAEVGQLKNLEVLDLSNNQLTGLPYELGNLSNLKVLNLKGNAYASADLNIIKQSLPDSTMVQVD